MSIVEGIGAYRARKQQEEERRAAADKPRVNRFALQKGGDSVTFRFGQEVDPDARHYSEKQGIGFVNIEHNHPDPNVGWMNRANCTLESQGACLPCEKVQDRTVEWADRKGWKQKEKFYINVIAGEPREVKTTNAKGKEVTKYFPTDIGNGEDTVYLLEQGTYNGIWDALVDYAVDDETILDSYWKVTRKGDSFNDTSYVLTKRKEIGDDAKDAEEYELIDLRGDILTEVPYAQQDAFYHNNVAGGGPAQAAPRETASAGASPASDTW